MLPQNCKSILPLLAGSCLFLLPVPALAIINFGLDNSGNTTDPGTGVPFDAVARVSNLGGADTSGSAVHLGDGYMLTADHVRNRSHVSFDGITEYARDTGFTPVQVAPGVDMKVFRLASTPPVSSVKLQDSADELIAEATMVGWGRGRDPSVPVDSASVSWGNGSTIDKRWGLNVPRAPVVLDYNLGGTDYLFQGLNTVLGSDSGTPAGVGANEGALAVFDSGSGLFQFLSGEWSLIGIAVTVETISDSNFGDDEILDGTRGDTNSYARVSAYEEAINGIIPEPAHAGLVFALLGAALVGAQRRGRRWTA
jgi:hypothetical protein